MILCKIGWHKWGKWFLATINNVPQGVTITRQFKRCELCNKTVSQFLHHGVVKD